MQPSPHTFQYPKVTPLASAAPKPAAAPSASSETPSRPQAA
ncbi:hypothetical protein [Baekduia sp.]|jgi:hypothetical protein|nr:hypothetical protein [Baekduia sp.]